MTPTEKKIRIAGIAGVVLAGLTLLQMLLPVAGFSPATLIGFILHSRAEAAGKPTPEIIWASGLYLTLNLFSLILVVALTVGALRKSRWCSVALTAYCTIAFLTSLPVSLFLFGLPSIILGVLLFLLFRGMMATIQNRTETGKVSAG